MADSLIKDLKDHRAGASVVPSCSHLFLPAVRRRLETKTLYVVDVAYFDREYD